MGDSGLKRPIRRAQAYVPFRGRSHRERLRRAPSFRRRQWPPFPVVPTGTEDRVSCNRACGASPAPARRQPSLRRRLPSLRRRLRPTTNGTLTYRLDGTLATAFEKMWPRSLNSKNYCKDHWDEHHDYTHHGVPHTLPCLVFIVTVCDTLRQNAAAAVGRQCNATSYEERNGRYGRYNHKRIFNSTYTLSSERNG